MLFVTTENIAGYKTVETLGQCFGVVVRSRGLGGNIMAAVNAATGYLLQQRSAPTGIYILSPHLIVF